MRPKIEFMNAPPPPPPEATMWTLLPFTFTLIPGRTSSKVQLQHKRKMVQKCYTFACVDTVPTHCALHL